MLGHDEPHATSLAVTIMRGLTSRGRTYGPASQGTIGAHSTQRTGDISDPDPHCRVPWLVHDPVPSRPSPAAPDWNATPIHQAWPARPGGRTCGLTPSPTISCDPSRSPGSRREPDLLPRRRSDHHPSPIGSQVKPTRHVALRPVSAARGPPGTIGPCGQPGTRSRDGLGAGPGHPKAVRDAPWERHSVDDQTRVTRGDAESAPLGWRCGGRGTGQASWPRQMSTAGKPKGTESVPRQGGPTCRCEVAVIPAAAFDCPPRRVLARVYVGIAWKSGACLKGGSHGLQVQCAAYVASTARRLGAAARLATRPELAPATSGMAVLAGRRTPSAGPRPIAGGSQWMDAASRQPDPWV